MGSSHFSPGKVSELESNADLHIEEVVSALMEVVAMEAAAEIRETSADGCGANCCWHRCFWIFLVIKRIWLVCYCTVLFLTSVYLEAPVSEGITIC